MHIYRISDLAAVDGSVNTSFPNDDTLIAGVIPFLGDKTFRCETMERIASSRNISKQTIRHYLYRYLKYQSIAALAPPSKKQPDQLTRDEKNMRWAINKFYYTRHKNSLTSAYTQMLKHVLL